MRHNGRTDKVIFRGYLEVKNKNEVSKSKFPGNKAKLDAIKKTLMSKYKDIYFWPKQQV